jgi:hypothetical protein
MRSIAKGRIPGFLATAQNHRLVFLSDEFKRLEPRSFMGFVTKGLVLAAAATAPFIAFPFFDLDLIGAELCRDWFLSHNSILPLMGENLSCCELLFL